MKLSITIPQLILDDEIWELAKKNLASIKKNTVGEYEIIFVDNASPLHQDWLKENCDLYIRNETNTGNAHAWNDGLKVATGDYLCLMDNDVIWHSFGWNEKMMEMLNNSRIGIVFPVSRNKEDDGWKIRLVGFCFIFSRKIFNEIGYISEEYGLGNFEDDDYFMRTLDAGYLLKVCKKAKIKHYSRATCDKIPEIQQIWLKNREYFFKKFQGRMPQLEGLQ